MSGVKRIMVNSVLSSVLIVLLLNSLHLIAHAAPQAVSAADATRVGSTSGETTNSRSTSSASVALTVPSTTTKTNYDDDNKAAASSGPGFASAATSGAGSVLQGPLNGVTSLIGGALSIATMPLNTITASLNQLGMPQIATAPLSAVSNLFQQSGNAYGR